MEKPKVKIKLCGYDDFSRVIFTTAIGYLLANVGSIMHMRLFTKKDNDFYGELEMEVNSEDFEVVNAF